MVRAASKMCMHPPPTRLLPNHTKPNVALRTTCFAAQPHNRVAKWNRLLWGLACPLSFRSSACCCILTSSCSLRKPLTLESSLANELEVACRAPLRHPPVAPLFCSRLLFRLAGFLLERCLAMNTARSPFAARRG